MLWNCWLGGRKGIRPVKNGGGWCRWALVSPDRVASSRMVGVSASVNLPLHRKVLSRGSLLALAHPGGPRKRAIKRLWYLLCLVTVWGENFMTTHQYIVDHSVSFLMWSLCHIISIVLVLVLLSPEILLLIFQALKIIRVGNLHRKVMKNVHFSGTR